MTFLSARPVGGAALLLMLLLPLAACSSKPANSDAKSGTGDAGKASSGSASSSSSESGSGSSSGAQPKSGQGDKGGAQPNDIVTISAEEQQSVGIRIAPVQAQQVPRMLSVTGQVQMDEKQTSHLGVLAEGPIAAVNVLPGALVQRGQTLGELHSHVVHETVGALIQAFADVDRQRGAVVFAQQAQARYHHLYSIQAASLEESQRSDQELLQAQAMLADADAAVHMEREHLSELLQVSPDSLTPAHLYDRELIPIRSPIDGVVITRNISVGQVVSTGFVAFDVSNLSTVWVTAAVNQQDVALIHAGASAQVTASGFPSQVFTGRVAQVGDTLDPMTRTIPVRIVVPNPGTRLRPGMFATAGIAEPATHDAVFVPETALQDINGMSVVFVTRDDTTFQARTVTVGARSMGKAEIVNGLSAGDHVVINGAFMVKSEMLKGTMGDG